MEMKRYNALYIKAPNPSRSMTEDDRLRDNLFDKINAYGAAGYRPVFQMLDGTIVLVRENIPGETMNGAPEVAVEDVLVSSRQ